MLTSAAVPEFLKVEKVSRIDIVLLDGPSPQMPFIEPRFGLLVWLDRIPTVHIAKLPSGSCYAHRVKPLGSRQHT
jgi:hypothetical protein